MVNDGENKLDEVELVENTNLGFVVLIVALFSINYLHECITSNSTTNNSTTSNSTTSNSTTVIFYW